MSLMKRIEDGDKSQSQSPGSEDQGDLEWTFPFQNEPGSPQDRARQQNIFMDLQKRVLQRIQERMELTPNVTDIDEIRLTIQELFGSILSEENIVLTRKERGRMLEEITAEILGLGPLQSLLADDAVTGIMVNGANHIFTERYGKITITPKRFFDDRHVLRIVDRIVIPNSRHIDEQTPIVEARLPDGSKAKCVIPPLSLSGPAIAVRKFPKSPFTMEKLIELGTLTSGCAGFLNACMRAEMNVLVCGALNSGKTTLVNILSGYLSKALQVISIEKTLEMQLRVENLLALECKQPNIEGIGEVTIDDLMPTALSMRPDAIFFGGRSGGEFLYLVAPQRVKVIGTMDCKGVTDALRRLELLGMIYLRDLSIQAIRERIASHLDIIVSIRRLHDGSRRVVGVSYVEDATIDGFQTHGVYQFEQSGVQNGKIIGHLKPATVPTKLADRFVQKGIRIPEELLMKPSAKLSASRGRGA